MTWIRVCWGNTVFRYWRSAIFRREALVNWRSILGGDTSGWCSIFETRMATFRLWAIISADLNDTLEVDVHTVWEFESLEVGEANYRCTWTKVFDLLESEIVKK